MQFDMQLFMQLFDVQLFECNYSNHGATAESFSRNEVPIDSRQFIGTHVLIYNMK